MRSAARLRRFILFGILLPLLWAWGANAAEVAVTLLHTNDLHQNLQSLPRIAGYVAEYKRAHPNTLFLDAGDFFDRGSPLARVTLGEAMYGAMARMGYDAWILGNHDWLYGDVRLLDLMQKYPVTVLGTNLATTTPPLPPNVVRTLMKDVAGIRVGFFGITLDTAGHSPGSRPHLYVSDSRAETAKAVQELKASHTDLIVAVTHLGLARMKQEVNSIHPHDPELAKAFPEIAVIVGGHTHTLLSEEATRKLYAETGAIIVQSGASGGYVGRLALHVDDERRRISRFEVENVPVAQALPEEPAVAAFLDEQYAQYMPNARKQVGEFAEPVEFHNMAYWYADFIKEQAGADLALVPRRSLYDEPTSFGKSPVTIEKLLGILYNRYVVKSTGTGADILRFCDTDAMRDRFNPFHHGPGVLSKDAFFCSGMTATFDPTDHSVKFDLDPDRSYVLATPWPFAPKDMSRYRNVLPSRDVVGIADPVPGLKVQGPVLLPQTTWEMLEAEGLRRGFKFHRKYPKPRPDWAPWTSYFESKLTVAR